MLFSGRHNRLSWLDEMGVPLPEDEPSQLTARYSRAGNYRYAQALGAGTTVFI